jgi:hypothetical protein
MENPLMHELRKSIQLREQELWKQAKDATSGIATQDAISKAWLASSLVVCSNALNDTGPGNEDTLALFDWVLSLAIEGKLYEVLQQYSTTPLKMES